MDDPPAKDKKLDPRKRSTVYKGAFYISNNGTSSVIVGSSAIVCKAQLIEALFVRSLT